MLGDYAGLYRDFVTELRTDEESLSLLREVGDDFHIAFPLQSLGMVYTMLNRGAESVEALAESIRIRRRIGDLSNLAFTLLSLDFVYIHQGRLSEADQLSDEVLAIHDEIGLTSTYPLVRLWKATIAFWRGDFDTAIAEVQGVDQFEKEQTYIRVDTSDTILSWVASMRGDYRLAYDLSQRRVLTTLPESDRLALALAACGLGDNSLAEKAIHDLLTDVPVAYSPTFQRMCLPVAAILAARANQPEWSAELLGLASRAPRDQRLDGEMASRERSAVSA